jgi:hypothetical protein
MIATSGSCARIPNTAYACCLHPRVFLAVACRGRSLLPGVPALRHQVRIRLDDHGSRGWGGRSYPVARRFRSNPNPPFGNTASAQAAGRTGTSVPCLSAKPGRRVATRISRRAHDLVGVVLARSLLRLRHPLVPIRGNAGGPAGCDRNGFACIAGVDYAGSAAATQHVRKYPSHVLQAGRLVSGVTQQPAAGAPGIREAG